MLTHDSMIALGLLAVATLIASFFAYLYTVKRQLYLLLWTTAWSLVALHVLSPALIPWVGEVPWQAALNQWLLSCAALLFFWAAQLYVQAKPWAGRIAAAAMVLLVWAIVHQVRWVPWGSSFGTGMIFLGCAWVFWQESRKQETIADLLLAAAFGLWGAVVVAIAFFERSPSERLTELRLLPIVPMLFIAMLMVMALYEEEKRRVERNMLALSNLNLATSSFVGGEIQRMLSQALDRVLGVVRIPAGALFLHHGDPAGPT